MNQETAGEPKPTYFERLVDDDDYTFPSGYRYQQDMETRMEIDIEKAIRESLRTENLREKYEHQKKKESFIRKLEESCLKRKKATATTTTALLQNSEVKQAHQRTL